MTVICCASSLPGNGPRLAQLREPAADEINAICECGFRASELSDVVEDWGVGPVLSEDGLAELVLFAEGNCLKSSCCLESQAEPSNAGEEVEDFNFILHLSTASCLRIRSQKN